MKIIVMDVQKGLVCDELYQVDRFIENTARVIAAARENRVEIIYVQHDNGPGSGFTAGDEAFEIAEQVKPREGEKVFTKKHGSCFGNPDFKSYLESDGEDTLIIMGLITDQCVDTTVKCAFEHGYRVIIPEGTNSTFDNKYMTAETAIGFFNDAVWRDWFATVLPVDETVALLKEQPFNRVSGGA